MKKIPVQLTEANIDYISSWLKNEAGYRFQSINNQILLSYAGTVPDDERIHMINIAPEMVIDVFNILSSKAEGDTNRIHRQIKDEFVSSLTATATAELAKDEIDQDMELLQSIGYLNNWMEERSNANDVWVENQKTEGRAYNRPTL